MKIFFSRFWIFFSYIFENVSKKIILFRSYALSDGIDFIVPLRSSCRFLGFKFYFRFQGSCFFAVGFYCFSDIVDFTLSNERRLRGENSIPKNAFRKQDVEPIFGWFSESGEMKIRIFGSSWALLSFGNIVYPGRIRGRGKRGKFSLPNPKFSRKKF